MKLEKGNLRQLDEIDSGSLEFEKHPPPAPPEGRGARVPPPLGEVFAIASIAFSEAAVRWGCFIIHKTPDLFFGNCLSEK